MLLIDKRNVKALFRRACALAALDHLDEAAAVLARAAKLEPENKEVARKLAALQREGAQRQRGEKQRFSGLVEVG